jgi:hypothetical protein
MTRLILLALFPVLVVAPHVIPVADGPVEGIGGPRNLRDVKDKGDRLPDAAGLEALARKDAVAFLEKCLLRYDREVKGYSLTMQKQERIEGKLQKKEVIDVHFKEGPHSVFMRWREGARLVSRVVYVDGQNDGKAVIKPAGLGSFLVVERDPDGADARRSGRYTLKEFGLKKGLQRTLAAFEAAQKDGALHVEYLGKRKIKEAGDRTCYVLKRTRYQKPEADGITEQTLFVDADNWLLVGTILKGGGKLIGEYFFRDIRLNPEFDKDQFTRKAVDGK